MNQDRKRSRGRAIVLFVLVLLVLQLTVFVPRNSPVPPPLSWATRIVPLTAAGLRWVGAEVRGAWATYMANTGAARELARLRVENDALRFQLDWNREQLRQRHFMDQALGWTPAPWRGAVGRIAYEDVADRYRSIWARIPDSGESIIGHAAVARGALLGRIVRRNGDYAQVLLLRDVESAVDVVSSSGIRGLVHGTGGRTGALEYVPRYEPLQDGELLVSTGRDAAFPGGYRVGLVTDVTRDPEALYLSGRVIFELQVEQVEWIRTVPVDAHLADLARP